MRMRMRHAAVAVLAAGAAFALSGAKLIDVEELKRIAEETAVIDAVEAGLATEEQFETAHRFILPSSSETKWREIPWTPDIWEGRIRSAQEGKPMFIWAMNGDPLGCV